MDTQSLSGVAQNYYLAMGNKDIQGMEQYMHPDLKFISPMSEMLGKAQVIDAAKGFHNLFDSLEIRHLFEGDNNTAMIVFDLICPPPISIIKAATLMHIENNLITKMELFFDTGSFERKS